MGKIKVNRVIGISMLVILYIGLVASVAVDEGIGRSVVLFGLTVLLGAFLFLAVYLITK